MKNYTITEEQIKELAKGNKKVEKMFPQIFKPIGWYKSYNSDNFLGFFDGEKFPYGITHSSEWKNNLFVGNGVESLRLATEEEVQEALIKEAKKRYKLPQSLQYVDSEVDDELLGWDLTFKKNSLGASGAEQDIVFKDGIWAEVKEEPIILNYHQIAKKFGINVNRLRISKF